MIYPCIIFAQRIAVAAPRFCIFTAPVGEVLEWSSIPRLSHQEPDGIQRAKNDYKVKGIKKFLSADDRNTIPTAIVITLAAGSYAINANESEIEINIQEPKAAFVVDGQHRLYGLADFDPLTKVPIVAILNASDEEKAFQFIVINNKVSKVAADHIRALALNFTDPLREQGLESRLAAARLSLNKNVSYVGLANNSADSPFRGILALPDNAPERQIVVPASIESSIAFIQSKNMVQTGSEDGPYELFITIWNVIKELWPLGFAVESKLLSKVGIQAMTQYIVDLLDFMLNFGEQQIDLSNSEDVRISVAKILALQDEKFWLAPWTISISDTKLVRDQILEALRKIQQNTKQKYPWFNELGIVDIKNDET